MIRNVKDFDNLNLEKESPRSGLCWSAIKGDESFVDKFIQDGARVNEINPELQNAPLHLAGNEYLFIISISLLYILCYFRVKLQYFAQLNEE